MIDRAAKLPVQGAVDSAEVVQEIGEGSYARAGGVSNRSGRVKGRMLLRQLPQEVAAETEGVLAADQARCVVVLPVIGEPALRYVGGNSESRDPVAQSA